MTAQETPWAWLLHEFLVIAEDENETPRRRRIARNAYWEATRGGGTSRDVVAAGSQRSTRGAAMRTEIEYRGAAEFMGGSHGR